MKVHNNLKFSYEFVRGSQSKRNQLVSSLNEKMVDELVPYLNDKNFKFNELKRLYRRVLPEQKAVTVLRSHSSTYDGFAAYIYDKNKYIIGQTIELPVRHCSRLIDYIITFAHENAHVLDVLANPKKTALAQEVRYMKSYSISLYNKIYDKILYSSEEFTNIEDMKKRLMEIEKTIKFLLKNKKNSDKIKILNDMRYDLESEKLAYAEQLRIAKILTSRGYKIPECELEDLDRVFWFTEKIQILKSIIYDLISQERNILAGKFNK